MGGADNTLARPTSRCRRTESIVSLERGVCSCAELQVFSCYMCVCVCVCVTERVCINREGAFLTPHSNITSGFGSASPIN